MERTTRSSGTHVVGPAAAALAAAALALSVAGLSAQETASRSSPEADDRRGLRPADLFRIEDVGRTRVSPDGELAAFERVRTGDDGARRRLSLFDGTRSDVWIARLDDAEVTPITSGGDSGTGWFRPRWSPDGERLALLSVHGEGIRAWIWNRSTGDLRKVSDRAVHMYLGRPMLFRWTGPRTLLFAAWPEDVAGRGRMLAEDMRPGARAARAWRKARSGRRSTASVLDAGVEDGAASLSPRELVAVDVTDGRERVVRRGIWGHLAPSPDGRHAVAFGFSSPADPPSEAPLSLSLLRGSRLDVLGLAGSDTGGAGPGSAGAAPADPERGGGRFRLEDPTHATLSWSPDGGAFALLDSRRGPATGTDEAGDGGGSGAAAEGAVSRPVRRAVVRGGPAETPRVVRHPERAVTGFAWSGDGSLLVRARRTGGESPAPPRWWRVDGGADWSPLTGDGDPAPAVLLPADDGALVGAAEGELWRISPDGEVRSLTRDVAPEVRRVAWPPSRSGPRLGEGRQLRGPGDPLVVEAGRGAERGFWVVDPSSDGTPAARLPADGPDLELKAFSPRTRTAVLLRRGPGATTLEAVRPSGAGWSESRRLVRTNAWLERIDTGEARPLPYRSREGRDLTGWLLLPPDHADGDRHPLVTWVYAGMVYDEEPPPMTRLDRASPTGALQLLAARGYAVLMPSMPLPPPGGDAGVRERLLDGVLPAVDSAVSSGLADSDRLGLMGQSYGGFSVYHIVSLTDRFRAAVASAGVTDLTALYGTFDRRSRYGHMHHPLLGQLSRMAWMESGQGRMGAPPWEAPERYRRESPITYVDRVETPLMMMHGDQDFVPLQQAEAFFTALQRRGERARLVRYFGEGHTNFGRANVLDQWNRIFDWFGRHLREPAGPAE